VPDLDVLRDALRESFRELDKVAAPHEAAQSPAKEREARRA
jgi:hypothetical protein